MATRCASMRGRRAGSTRSTSAATRRPPEVRFRVAHRHDVQTQPHPPRRALERHRAAARGGLAPQPRQRPPHQPLQAAAVGRQPSLQRAVAVAQRVAAAEDLERRRVRLQHPPGPVQLHRADAVAVQQARQAGAQRIGRRQRLTHADELADMRRQALHEPDPGPLPAAIADGIGGRPDQAQAVGILEVQVQAVLPAQAGPSLVVHRRRLPLVFGPEVGERDRPAFGQADEAAHAHVVGVVDAHVFARQILPVLAAAEIAGEVDAVAGTIVRTFADRQAAAPDAAGLVDQGARRRPPAIVESGFVQQREDALERIVRFHAALPLYSALRAVRPANRPAGERRRCPRRSARGQSGGPASNGRRAPGQAPLAEHPAQSMRDRPSPVSFKIEGIGPDRGTRISCLNRRSGCRPGSPAGAGRAVRRSGSRRR